LQYPAKGMPAHLVAFGDRETGCPDVETVIGILRPGEPVQMLCVLRPIVDVAERDVEEACRHAQKPETSDQQVEASPTAETPR
jgi:hypothetical protein